MTNRYIRDNEQNKGRSIVSFVAWCAAALILVFILIFFFRPQIFKAVAFQTNRVKNTVSYYLLQSKPHFYYLEMEKNGKDIKASSAEVLEITYRDEFVVKSVVCDDLSGKYMTLKIEGLSKGDNDLRVLFRGIDLVNKIMLKGVMNHGAGTNSDYKILINYKDELLAEVPILIVLTPQDWLRYAKDSTNVNVQVEYLKKAISLNREDTSVRKILAGIYLRTGRLEDAISQYKDILAIKPDDAAALSELTKCYIRKKEYDNALETSRKLIKINPRDVEAYASMGYALEEKGRWDQAIESYLQAVKIDPDNYPVRFKLGDAYIHKKKIVPAIEQYQYIVDHSANADAAMIALGDVYLKTKKYNEAIKYYKEVIKNQPKFAAAYANLALAYAGKGKLQEELDNLKKAAELSPDEPIIRYNLGVAYERRKLDTEAVKEYEHVLKISPDDNDAAKRLADLFFKNKKYDQAIKYYEKLSAALPNDSSILANLGFAYGELKNYKASAEKYEKAIAAGGKTSNLHYNLAYTYGKLGRQKDSIAEYEKISPLNKEVLTILGQYYLKEKKFDQAVKYYKKIVDLEPKKAASYAGLGYVYFVRADWNKTIENYLIALKYDKEDDEVYSNLGEAYEKKGLYAEALKAYTNAYQLNPDSAKAAKRIPKLRILLLQQKAQKSDKEKK
jgi:tetratricopeptide (TPR) repeat protein